MYANLDLFKRIWNYSSSSFGEPTILYNTCSFETIERKINIVEFDYNYSSSSYGFSNSSIKT